MRKAVFILDQVTRGKINSAADLGFEWIFSNGKNLTPELVVNAHRKGMKVVAEVGLFCGEGWWQKYPDCRPVGLNGKSIKKVDGYAGVCPNHPGVRQEKLEEIKQLVGKLEIEGVWLDFVRYPCHWEDVRQTPIEEYCYCDNCRRLYGKTDFGSERWYEWKADQIVGFVREVRDVVDRNGKRIELGLFGVPWVRGEFEDAILKIIGQDFEKLAEVVDVFSPMVYQLMCGRKPDWINGVVNEVAGQTGKPVWPIIQTEDKPVRLKPDEFDQEIKSSLVSPSIGSIVFFWEDLVKNSDKLRLVGNHFGNKTNQ